MLTNYPGICRNLYLPDYTLFDLETTGVSCRSDDVVEISALRVRGGAVVNSFSSLVNPGRHIPGAASQVNHITDEMVAGAPTMEEVLPEFLVFIGEDVLVGHNIARFDMKFLHRDCTIRFGAVPGNDYIDTLVYARTRLPGLRSYSLAALADHYGLSTAGISTCRIIRCLIWKPPAFPATMTMWWKSPPFRFGAERWSTASAAWSIRDGTSPAAPAR